LKKLIRELYGTGIIFFYYLKIPMLFGYPALIYGADYPRYWVMDILWIYCLGLIILDIYRVITIYRRRKLMRERNNES
jgi:uncharacterized membrane protein